MSEPSSSQPSPSLVQVAVPLPLPGALTYRLPAGFLPRIAPGMRVRVPVGKKRHVGFVVALDGPVPEGVRLRDIESLVDEFPLLPEDLLRLARFCADYYLAPLGEVLRVLVPGDLPGWGQGRVQLTNAGALAFPRDREEGEVIEALRQGGRLSLSDLQRQTGLEDLGRAVRRLADNGWVRVRRAGESSSRVRTAYELSPGQLEQQLEACGRSEAGRAVVRYLHALERPAALKEMTDAAGCTASVVRRLVALGLLRTFTQLKRQDLDHHSLSQQDSERLLLRPDQGKAVEALSQALDNLEFRAFLLQGMTGSGKTEVYLRAVEQALAQGRGAILLVPEIALVPALARTIKERFGQGVALLHSNLSANERRQEWQRIQRGEASVVLGPRSAIFAPLPKLGLIVVDEEQDSAYKQESTPRYNGRDLALVRGRNAGAVVALVSATPSLESRLNALQHRYEALTLTQRAGQGSLPEGILVDMKEEGGPRRPGEVRFSIRMRQEIERALEEKSQIILLRNRRGYAPQLLCRACGEAMRCDDCGLPRTYHRREEKLLCHYCGSFLPVPEQCPSCQEISLEAIGTGTERVEEELRDLYPRAVIDVLDRDVVRRRGGAADVLERFAQGRTQILVGTQMVSKGHHFPEVGLTGVLSADTYLGFPDFRAVEKTYNLLVQLAGRAGRGERPGRVVIQTYHPDHYAIRAALLGRDEAFAEEELRFRRIFHYPPYTRMVYLLLQDSQRLRGLERLRRIARDLEAHPLAKGVRVRGPAPAPLERIRGKWRFQLLLRSAQGQRLRRLVQAVVPAGDSDLSIDVDPQDLL